MQTIINKHPGKTKSQFLHFFVVATLAALIFFCYLVNNPRLAVFWIFGTAFGFVAERSRFCFVAAFRDPIIAGSTSLLRAMIISLAIMTVFIPLIQYHTLMNGASIIPGQIDPVGLNKVIGGVIFGIGMVIASGCASGTLIRIGEGFVLQLFVLSGFLAGSLAGAKNFHWWYKNFIAKGSVIHLSQLFGWFGAVAIQLFVLGILYYLALKFDQKNNIMI
ncbi:MAG: YeeE/YedE thiosulfate transporter family protein [Bacillota bacterium]